MPDARAAGGGDITNLERVELDLLRDEGWRDAAEGCRYLKHVASPFVLTMPRDRNDLIGPAVQGTKRALAAAFDAGHERVVLTSSLAAIDGGHENYNRVFSEADWTELSGPLVNAYIERSEENTSALQSLMRISSAVFCL